MIHQDSQFTMSCVCPYEWHWVFQSLRSTAHNYFVKRNKELLIINRKTTESAVVTLKPTWRCYVTWSSAVQFGSCLFVSLTCCTICVTTSILIAFAFIFNLFSVSCIFILLQWPLCHIFTFICRYCTWIFLIVSFFFHSMSVLGIRRWVSIPWNR